MICIWNICFDKILIILLTVFQGKMLDFKISSLIIKKVEQLHLIPPEIVTFFFPFFNLMLTFYNFRLHSWILQQL